MPRPEELAYPLFVYGTLLARARPPECVALMAGAELLGTASLRGHLYRVGSYPALVAAAVGREIHGELYWLRSLAQLVDIDVYEGIMPAGEGEPEYVRRLLSVRGPTGQAISAWVYLYNLPVCGLESIERWCP